jgi:hypothetical protein
MPPAGAIAGRWRLSRGQRFPCFEGRRRQGQKRNANAGMCAFRIARPISVA